MSNKEIQELSQAELDLLDISLDEIEELPGFECPYNGDYVLNLTASMKKINDKWGVEMQYEVVECLEKNNPEDPDTIPGTKFSQLFFLEGKPEAVKVAKSFLKILLRDVAEELGESNLLILVRDHLKNLRVRATVLRRKDKHEEDVYRPNVKNMTLA
jgi:hypothetical protein